MTSSWYKEQINLTDMHDFTLKQINYFLNK